QRPAVVRPLPRGAHPDVLRHLRRDAVDRPRRHGAVPRDRRAGGVLDGGQGAARLARSAARPRARAVLDQLPRAHDRLAGDPRARGVGLAGGAGDRAAAVRHPVHARGGAARRRLQLPAAHDPAPLRGLRPGRRVAARGLARPGGEPAAHLLARHPAARAPRHHRRRAARLHPPHGRLHHGHGARRGQGQHGGADGGGAVPDRPELGARLGDGRHAHHRDRALGEHHRRPAVARVVARAARQPCRPRRGELMSVTPNRIRRPLLDRLLPVWAVVVFAFLFAPIIVIIVYSFNTGRLLSSFTSVGVESFLALFEKPVLMDAVMVSLRTGAIAAVLATLLGTLAGIALARRAGKWTAWFVGLLVLVSVTPEIVDAISLLPWL